MKARDLMTAGPCCCSPDDSIQEVAQMMRDHDCGSVPIVENNQVIGIVTDRDLAVRALADGLYPGIRVRNVMYTYGPGFSCVIVLSTSADHGTFRARCW